MFLYSNIPDDRLNLDGRIVACAVDLSSVQSIEVDGGDVELVLPVGTLGIATGIKDLTVWDVLQVLAGVKETGRFQMSLEYFIEDLTA